MRTSLIIITTLLLLLPLTTTAQWTPDPWNGMVSVCHQEGDQISIRVGRFEGSGYTMVCYQNFADYQNPVAYYQILTHDGTPLYGLQGTSLIDGDPWFTAVTRVIPDGAGGLITIFEDRRDGPENEHIYGQRFDPWGERLWGEMGLPLVIWPGNDVSFKDVAYDSLGNGFIAWVKNTLPTTEMYIQRFSLITGETDWGELGVMTCGGVSFADYQQIVADGQGGVYDLWEDGRHGGYDFYVQHVDSSGNFSFAQNGIPVIHAATGNPTGGLLRDGVSDGQGGGIWIRETLGFSRLNVFRLAPNGRMLWEWNSGMLVPEGFAQMLSHPADHSVYVTRYEDRTGSGGVYRGYLYRIDVNGNGLFGPNGISLGGDDGGKMTATSDGVITTVVEHETQQSTTMRATRIDSSGAIKWATDYALGGITPGGGSIFIASHGAPDGDDGVVWAFRDNRDTLTATDLSAQRVCWDGSIAWTAYKPSLPEPVTDGLVSLGEGLFQFMLTEPGPVSVDLYNLLGQRVAILEDGTREAGTHTLRFDDRNLSSGIYILRLTTQHTRSAKKLVVVK